MKSDWQESSLAELANINPRRIIKKDDMAPFIDMAALPSNFRDIPLSNIVMRKYTGGGSKFRNGDTLLARITPCLENGKTALVSVLPNNISAHGSTEFIVLSPSLDADSLFLYYLVRSEQFRSFAIARMEGTSGRQRVPNESVGQYTFLCPPMNDRKKIGAFLGALDDRISLLRETNTTLEAIAQTLFKSWFVDFDPVRAKAEGRAPEGIDAETAALFPDSFVESELGLMPKGWKTGKLLDIAKLNPESWTTKNHPDTVAYIDLANAKDNNINEVNTYSYESAPSRARRVLRDGDTIVGTVRPGNRSFAFIYDAPPNLTGSTGFAVLRAIEVINTEFIYIAVTKNSCIDYLAHVADGGAYPAVRPEIITNIEVIIPSPEVMLAFHLITQPLLRMIANNQQQSKTLAATRDTLLPRLISGQLQLPDEVIKEDAK